MDCQALLRVREVVTVQFQDEERQVEESLEAVRREVEYFALGPSFLTVEEAGDALRRHGAPVSPCTTYNFSLKLVVQMEGDAFKEGPKRQFNAGNVEALSDEHRRLHFDGAALSQECLKLKQQQQQQQQQQEEREGKAFATTIAPEEVEEDVDDQVVYYDEDPLAPNEDDEEASGEEYPYIYDDDEEEESLAETLTEKQSSSLAFVIPILILLLALLVLGLLAAFAVLARRKETEKTPRGDESAAKEFEHQIPLAEDDGGGQKPIIKGATTT